MKMISRIGGSIACIVFIWSIFQTGSCVITLAKFKSSSNPSLGMLSDACQSAVQPGYLRHSDKQMLSNEDPVDNAFSHAIVRRYSYTFEEIEAQINSVGGQSEDMVQHAENNFVNKEILVYLSMRVDSLNLMIDSRLSVYPGTIYLERCCLRPLRREDAETLTKVYGDPENMKLFRTGTTLNKEEIRNEIAWVEGNMHSDKPDVVAWSIITGDGIIGDFRIYDLRKEAKVRCCIAPEWHNRGIASSLRGIVNSPSIRDLNLPYITTTTHPDNLTSKSVLQHIGFEKLGVVPRYGVSRDLYVLFLNKQYLHSRYCPAGDLVHIDIFSRSS